MMLSWRSAGAKADFTSDHGRSSEWHVGDVPRVQFQGESDDSLDHATHGIAVAECSAGVGQIGEIALHKPFRLQVSSSPRAPLGHCFVLLLFLFWVGRLSCQQADSPTFDGLIAAARQAQAAHQYAEAASKYKQAVQLRPDMPELWANLGLMQHEAEQYAEAIQSFQRTIQLKSSLYVPNLFLGIDYVRLGKAREAIPLLIRAERLNTIDPLAPLTLGRAYALLGENDSAIRELRHALSLDPKQSSAWFHLGLTQLDEVEGAARTMAGTHGETAYAKALYAESLTDQARYKEAGDTYAGILALGSQPPCMISEEGWLYLKEGNAPKAEASFKVERRDHPECLSAVLGQAKLRIDAQDDQEAQLLLQQVWSQDHGFLRANAAMLFEHLSPQRVETFTMYLTKQQSSGSIETELVSTLVQLPQGGLDAGVSEIVPPDAIRNSADRIARHIRGKQEYMAAHYRSCADLLSSFLKDRDAEALQTLAACSFFTGDYALSAEAASALRLVLSRPPAEALYWLIRANEQLAVASLARFQQLEPSSARSHILLGDVYRQRNRYDDAQQEYAKALEFSPNDFAALMGLASAYFGNANLSQTLEAAQRALLQSPNDPEVNLLIGEVLTSQHKYGDAEPFLIRSLHAKPQRLPHVHALLGEVYVEEGKAHEALRELRLGAESDRDGTVHYRLARLYSQLGDSGNAAIEMQEMKALQQKRRDGAVTAVRDAPASGAELAP